VTNGSRNALMIMLKCTVDSKRGYLIPKQERALVDATGGSATYGELMPEGIEDLVRTLALTENDVFMGGFKSDERVMRCPAVRQMR